VFDNADHEPDMITKFLPAGNQGNILITSRNPNMRCLSPDNSFIEIVEMEKESAVSLLLKSAFLDSSDNDLRVTSQEIVKELCSLPLAVDQAGAAIASGLCDIGEYLEMYRQHRQRLLDDPTFKGASNYGRAVYGTWDVSFVEIVARAAKEHDPLVAQGAAMAIFLLQTFSFLHCEGISEEIFCRAAEASKQNMGDSHIALGSAVQAHPDLIYRVLQLDTNGTWDPIWFREGICVLLSFSFIKRSKINSVYSVHHLVHSWSRDRISIPDHEIVACCARGLLSQSITDQFLSQDIEFRQMLVPHIKANQQYTTKRGVRKAYDDIVETKFGFVYYEKGYWKEVEELIVQVVESSLRLLGAEHPGTLTSIGNLAVIYNKQGQWKKAEDLQVQVMESSLRLLGAEHPDTLRSIGNLAWTYTNQRQWKKAEELQVQVMESSLRLLGAEHPGTLTSIGNLAVIYDKQGQWKKAEELQVQVMESSLMLLGAEHLHTLTSIGSLAWTYTNQGQWKKAEELQVQVMESSLRLLGAEHPDTLTSIGNLASTYRNQGQWKKAEELQVQVMESSLRLLGAEHPDTLRSIEILALLQENQGE
jgi:tetratricopeptide (TPR) repeat protein